MFKQSDVRCKFYSTSQYIVLPNELHSRLNVLRYCQRYSSNIDSVIAFRFNIKNIDCIANTASDDFCNRLAMLNELLQCRDGMLCLSDDSFSSNEVEQLIYFLCTS